MLNNFIYSKTKDLFLEQLEAGHVLDEAVAFIEDTKEIWNHGTYFDGTNVREYAFPKTGGLITGVSSYPLQLKSSSDIYSTIRFITNNNDYITFGFKNSDNPQLFFTNKNGWDNEYFLYHSGNFNPSDYLPLAGGNMRGNLLMTGGHLITHELYAGADNTYDLGNSSRRWANIYTMLINGGTPIHSGNVGEYNAGGIASGVSTDDYLQGRVAKAWYDWNANTGNGAETYSYGIYVGAYDTGYGMQLATTIGSVSFLRTRVKRNSAWEDWKTIAFTDSDITGNAASATKLQTARTIWGQSFDGTEDVSGDLNLRAWKLFFNGDAANYFITCQGTSLATYNMFGGHSFCTAGGTQRMLINTSGNVTIGGSDLAGSDAKLYVDGHVYVGNQLWVNGHININRNGSTGALYDASKLGFEIEPFATHITFNAYKSGGNIGSVMAIANSGNVLIGTTEDKGAKLQVNGYLSLTKELLLENNQAIRFKNISGENVYGMFVSNTTDTLLIGHSGVSKINLRQNTEITGDLHVTGNIIADGEVSAGGGISTTEDLLSYGVEWDTTQSTPDCTRIGNPLLHKSLPIQSKLRGCVANGNNINYYLYSEDWAYKEDGTTPSILDGTDGTVRVDTGAKFYIKSGSNGTKRWVRISTIQIDSSWIEVKRMLIDAYRCTVDTTDSSTPKTASVVNTSAEFRGGTNSSSYDSYLSTDVFRTQLGKPRTNVTRATMRTYAKNAGSQLLNYNDYKAVLYWLPVIEFATFNIQQSFNANPTSDGYKQGGLSAGVTNMGSTNWSNYNGYNPITPCGYANSLGNHTGVVTFTTPADSAASVTAVTHSIARWRGFENIFGDIWTNLDGILIEYNATIGKHDVYSCDNSEYFADSLNEHYTKIGEQIASDGYIGEFDLGESAEIIPSSVGGSTTTKKCDYSYQITSAGLRTLLVGGSADYGGLAGLGCFNSANGVGSAYAHVGFRTSNYKD